MNIAHVLHAKVHYNLVCKFYVRGKPGVCDAALIGAGASETREHCVTKTFIGFHWSRIAF